MLASQRGIASQSGINATRLAIKIRVVRDRDDAGMLSRLPMQRNVVFTIACEDGTAEARREAKLVPIRDSLVRLSRLQCR
jgi:hypothetical protein